MLRECHHGAARAENPGLFACNGRDCRSQPFSVIERDIGDDREQWFYDIGRVQPPAHAYFQDRDIHLLRCEVAEGHCRHCFKEAWFGGQGAVLHQLIRSGFHLLETSAEDVIRNLARQTGPQ